MLLHAMLAALAFQAPAAAPPAATPPAATPPTPARPSVTVPPQPALTAQIAARSAEYFDIFFERCAPENLRAIVSPDFEMYHDRNGVRRSAEAFVARYAGRCAEASKPEAARLRRRLVPGSLLVDPVPRFGAIEEGRHDFYEVQAGKPERKVSTARYLHLWALTPEGWRLARVFSYRHEAPQ